MFKNVASQKLTVFAFDSTTNLPKTGDAANLTAYVDIDDGGVTVLGDTSATEKDATNAKGYYIFDLTQAETNGNKLLFSAKSSTSNIVVIAVPAVVYTAPANFTATSIDSSGKLLLQATQSGVTIPTVTTVTNQLTGAAIATAIFQDTTAGDFTVSGSIGKSIMNGVSLGTGLTVAAVSGAVGSVTGAVGSVTGNVGGNVTGSVGSISGVSFPTNFGNMAITVGGIVKADLQTILTTALTETSAGYLAASFKKLHDVASPVLTTASVNQTGDSYARIGATGSGLTSLAPAATALSTATWTGTRAGYLDNLPGVPPTITGTVSASPAPTNSQFTTDRSEASGVLNDRLMIFTSGALLNESKAVWNYAGSGLFQWDENWSTAPSAGDTFKIVSYHTHSKTQIASTVWSNSGRTLTAGTNIQLPSNGLANVTAWTVDITGTLTTVTNLTNAPTSGDFTSTMKTSLNAATPTVTVSGTVTLATSQPNYAPAKAGDAMTLTSAYDAAKTAAQAGNQMDLVNAPNATAVTAIQSGLATSASLSGLITTVGVAGAGLTGIPKTGYKLASDGIDAVLIESSITAGANLTNDSGTQLTSINARQALSLVMSAAAAGVLAGAATTTVTTKPGGLPSGNTRVSATVDSDGNRSAMVLKVPT